MAIFGPGTDKLGGGGEHFDWADGTAREARFATSPPIFDGDVDDIDGGAHAPAFPAVYEEKKLTLQGIYTDLAKRFQWFREHQDDNAWKNSIRHNLSLNKVFKNMRTEKGGYWELDVSGGEGYKRPRKRRSQSEKRGGLKMVGEDDLSDEDSYSNADRRHSTYTQAQRAPTHPRLRLNTDLGSMPNIDPAESQGRPTTSTYRHPRYGPRTPVARPATSSFPPPYPALHTCCKPTLRRMGRNVYAELRAMKEEQLPPSPRLAQEDPEFERESGGSEATKPVEEKRDA
ncbi:hypothetical protein B0H11DRAFT_2216883 [Mycena galericulata]|nr:hypothetical protein B0H11DRAFT_2216883 [Mycena galericulata]